MKKYLRNKKIILVIGCMFLGILLLLGIIYFPKTETKLTNFNSSVLTEYSSIVDDETRSVFNMFAKEGYLYKTKRKGKDAALEVLSGNMPYGEKGSILPPNYLSNAKLSRSSIEENSSTREHYFFTQSIRGIPIFGAQVAVHIKNGNEVYSVQGKVSKKNDTTMEKISEEEARNIALQEASNENAKESKFFVTIDPKTIINQRVLGIGDDSTNYVTVPIVISTEDSEFSKTYFVSLEDGKIVYKKTNILDALNRSVYSCKTGSCTQVRTEGQPAAADSEANEMYDYLGATYNYFNTLGRDSYDNAGSLLRGYAYYPQYVCPSANARWDGLNRRMLFGPGLSKGDVVGHELAHGVTQFSAGLEYEAQSGALNESFSDIAGSAIDQNWAIGEGHTTTCIPKPLRSMDNPPSRNQPDRMYASQYTCAGLTSGCSDLNDFCGVHVNSGVLNKAFYLMTDGGSFNGCQISAIGRTRSHAIIYQALTHYLNPFSNFKEAYDGILTACNDLYTSDPGVCEQVTKALQATEMDQQAPATQSGPKCTGAPPQTPACAGGGSGTGITITPFPTSGTGGGSTPGTYKVSGKVYIDTDNSGGFNAGDTPYSGATLALSDGPKSGSTTTNSSGDYILAGYPSGLYTLTLSILGSKKEEKPVTFGPDVEMDFRIFSSQTEPTIVPKPTIKAGPTIGDGPSPTPTPVPHICEFDPSCAAQKKNLQLCKLICRPKE